MGSVDNEHVPRVSTAGELQRHLTHALTRNLSDTMPNDSQQEASDRRGVEGHIGATQRQWKLLLSFL